LRAGLPEELVGEFEKPGEVIALVDAIFDRVVWWFLFGVVPKHERFSLVVRIG
jgi:hypothetical protein